jgi:hypothetical protein
MPRLLPPFLSEDLYLKIARSAAEVENGKSVSCSFIFEEQDQLTKLEVPVPIKELSEHLGLSLFHTISALLRIFSFEYKEGSGRAVGKLLSSIQKFDGIPEDTKKSLTAFVLSNFKEG